MFLLNLIDPTAQAALSDSSNLSESDHEAHSEGQSGSSSVAPKLRKGKRQVPVDTSTLRRSNRSTKYDGFRVLQPTDSRASKSKVKPRNVPSAQVHSEDDSSTDRDMVAPPPTSISSMQAIGTQLCAIPEEELTVEALTMSKEGSSSAN